MSSSSAAALRPGVASFWHDLPREGRLLLSQVVIQFLGTGLVLPFQVVYLHEVRDLALGDVGLLLAMSSLVGFLIVGVGGALIDRVGARAVMLASLVLLIAGDVALSQASTFALAAMSLTMSGAALGVMWPASQTMIAAVVPARLRQRYFGVNFTLLNVGIGLGGVIGGTLLDVSRPETFQAIYLLDAASYTPALLLLLLPLRHVAGRPEHRASPETRADARTGYLTVLRRPAVASLTLLSFISSFVGYSQLTTGMPAFARAVGEVSTRSLGYAFAANTAVIVVLQLVVLQRIEGHRRTRVIALMGVLWSLSWLLLGGAGLVPGTVGATLLVTGCTTVFALGETLLQPTVPALVNDLAPDHLRGRYNALNWAAFKLAAIIAPPTAGVFVDRHWDGWYVGTLVAGSLLLGLIAVVRLERQLPAGTNGERISDHTDDTTVEAPAGRGAAADPVALEVTTTIERAC